MSVHVVYEAAYVSVQQQLGKQTKSWRENVCRLKIIGMIMIHPSCLISTDKTVRPNSGRYGLSQVLYAAHQRQAITLIQASKRVSFCC